MTAIGFHRTPHKTIDLSTDDRRRHLYVIGQTGVGKSTLLESMALDDIRNGYGVVFIDPHGQSAARIADNIPVSRTQDVAYIEYDAEHPFGLNILETADPRNKPLTVEHVVSTFRNIWSDSWGANLEDVLRNSLYLLLDRPRTSLADMLPLISDKSYRAKLLRTCGNDVVRHFWQEEFEAKADRQKAEETRSTTNKIRAFLSNPYLANIVAGPSTLNVPHLMNHRKILILNLAKGSWGETPSKLLGCLFVIAFAQAAEQRANIPEHKRNDFHLYIDEVQNFQNDALAIMLSESRKMRLSLTLANQFYAQLPDKLQAAISGNVGTWIAFRLGAKDAQLIGNEFAFTKPLSPSNEIDPDGWAKLLKLPNFTAWVKTLVDTTISAMTLRTSRAKMATGRAMLNVHARVCCEQTGIRV
jgi:hypothetical protein